MTDVSATQLATIRTTPQYSELNLSIYQPPTLLACRVNDSAIAKGARSVTFDTVSDGSYSKVFSGSTVLVGSTLGAQDLGKVRAKSCTSNTLVVAENSDVKWADRAYLTVIGFIDIVPIFPRIVALDPNYPENLTWYKDYDIVYSGQNSVMGAEICAGPHRAAMLENGSATLYYTATGTSHMLGDDLTYYWEFPGASGVTGSTALTPGTITYQTPGHYLTKLSVSGSFSQSGDTTYRYVSIYAENTLARDWEISNIQGSRNGAGFSASVTLHSPWRFGNIYNGSVIVLYGKDWYGSNQQAIGGNAVGNSNIFFCGYIIKDTIQWDFEKSSVKFDTASITEIMKYTNGFAISLEDEVAASTWYQIPNMNLNKAIYHFLRWHSTVLLCTDIQFVANDRLIQFFDTNRESLFDAINSVMKTALMGDIVADRQGKIWLETSMQATHLAKTAYPPKHKIEKIDWMQTPQLEEAPIENTSYLELGGIAYGGGTSKISSAYLSAAPGATPGLRGKVDSPNGLALISQTELNTLSGDMYAYLNAKQPYLKINLVGARKNLDIAPQEVYSVIVQPDDTTKNAYISGSYFFQDISWAYEPDKQQILCAGTMREVTEGVPGETLIIPATPPQENIASYDIPPFNPPQIVFPIPGSIVTPYVPTLPLGLLTVFFPSKGLWGLATTSTSPEWYPIAISGSSSWSPSEISAVSRYELSNTGEAYLASTYFLWSQPATIPLSTRKEVYASTLPHVRIGGMGMDMADQYGLVIRRDAEGSILGGNQLVIMKLQSDGTIIPTYSPSFIYPNSFIPTYFSRYVGKWFMSGPWGDNTVFVRVKGDLSGWDQTPAPFGYPYPTSTHVHAKVAEISYVSRTASFGNLCRYNGYQTGALPTPVSCSGLQVSNSILQSFDCDPTGQVVIAVSATGGALFRKSVNYGNSFSDLTNFPSLSYDGRAASIMANGRVYNMGITQWVVTFTGAVYLDPGSPATPTLNYLHIFYSADNGANWVDYTYNFHTNPALEVSYGVSNVNIIKSA